MKKILQGLGVSSGKAQGKVVKIQDHQESPHFEKGDILVAHITDPSMVTLMGKAGAIITDIGGMTSHPAIVSREMGIPCVVATKIATQVLREGQYVEVDGTKGEVYGEEESSPSAGDAHIRPVQRNAKDSIDEYLASARAGILKMDFGTLQPFDSVEIDPLFASTWIPWLLHLIQKIKESGMTPLETARLWHNPSSIRNVIFFDLFMAKYAPITTEERLTIARFYTDQLEAWCLEDPFAFKKNVIHRPEELQTIFSTLKPATADIARTLGRLASSCYHLAYGLFDDLNPQIVYDNYGPYDVTEKYGPNHIAVIKEFENFKPVEFWSGVEDFPYEKVQMVCVYKNVDFSIDAITHTNYSGDIINNLVEYSVKINGEEYEWNKLDAVTQEISLQAETMWNRFISLDFENLKIKYAHQKAYNYIHLSQKLNLDWRPSQEVLAAIKGKPLSPAPKFASREAGVNHTINLLDPRT